MMWDGLVLSQDPWTTYDEGVGVFLAQNWDLDGVIAVRDGIDDGFVDRDHRIFRFVGEPAIEIAPLECFEERRIGDEGTKVANLLRDGAIETLVVGRRRPFVAIH